MDTPLVTKKSIWTIVSMIFINSLVRSFLEFFSNPEIGGMISPWYTTLEYLIFFTTMTVGLGIIVGLLTKESFVRTTARVAKFLPIILIAPIIDLIVSQGSGICMSYISSQGPRLVFDFFTFGGVFKTCGITIGMRIEILLIILGLGYGIWKKTSSLPKAILGTILSYIFIFLNGAIPGIFGIVFTNIESFVFTLARIHFLTLVGLLTFAWMRTAAKEFWSWTYYSIGRFQILFYYLVLGMVGVFWSYSIHATVPSILVIITSIVVILLNCFTSGIVNDIADQSIDAIAHPTRPLGSGQISLEHYRSLGIIFFVLATIGSLFVSYPFFLFMLGFQCLYAAYSLVGIRWKKHFISSSLSIGGIALCVILAGYFIATPAAPITEISQLHLLIIFVTVVIISNAKDFADVKGDKPNNIQTLPVVFGKKNANIILTVILSAWIIIVSIILKDLWISILVIPWVIIDLILKKRVPQWVRYLILFVEILFIISRIK